VFLAELQTWIQGEVFQLDTAEGVGELVGDH
jgi:hypothetical protein